MVPWTSQTGGAIPPGTCPGQGRACLLPEWGEVLVSIKLIMLHSVLPLLMAMSRLQTYSDEMDGISNLTLVSNVSQILMRKHLTYQFRKVNHAPWFRGTNVQTSLHVSTAATGFVGSYLRADGSYLVSNWTGPIYKGVLDDGSPLWDEEAQRVSFEVRALVPSFFKVQPRITADGNLSFIPADNVAGRTSIDVVAKDSGGTLFHGQDTSLPRRFFITLTGTGVHVDNFLNLDSVSVQRSFSLGLGYTIVAFADPQKIISAGASSMDFLTTSLHFSTEVMECRVGESNQSVVPPTLCFELQPSVSPEGSLSFEPAVGVYGVALLRFQIKMGNGAVSAWRNFRVHIEYVNYPPSFDIRETELRLLEDSSPQMVPRFAVNISKGLFEEDIVLGVSSSNSPFKTIEGWQGLKFDVVRVQGKQELFQLPPELATNGTLFFTVASHENGNATFSVALQDSGGPSNTSIGQNFTIIVTPVNDAPSFNMPSSYTMSESSKNEAIVVPEFAQIGVWNHRFQGPANEASQNISFLSSCEDESAILFTENVSISSAGVLRFTVAAYRWGASLWKVTLYDSGGSENGGSSISESRNLTIRVMAVNTDPTIGLPAEIWLWVNPVDTPREPYMMVRHRCCSPCPGPTQIDFSCRASHCCRALSEEGIMATIPSVANFSAGPFEGHMQNVSFNVSANNLLLFSGTDFPRVNVDGMIDFGIATSSSGNATMDIIMVDSDGGRSQDVVNISVLAGHVELELDVAQLSLLSSTQIRLLVAESASVDLERIIIGDVDMDGRSNGIIRRSNDSRLRIQIIGESIFDLVQSDLQSRSVSDSRIQPLNPSTIYARCGNGETASVHFSIPSSVEIPESNQSLVSIEDIFVDKSKFLTTGVQDVSVTAHILSHMIPGISYGFGDAVCNDLRPSSAKCVETHGFSACKPCLFVSAPTVNLVCEPYCHRAELTLHSTYVPGEAMVEVTVRQSAPWTFNLSKTFKVTIPESPDAPRIQSKYVANLRITEDGGPCSVRECQQTPVILNLSEVIFDADMWLPGAENLTVLSSNPSMLNCSINPMDGTLILIPGLHKHGFVNVTAVDSTGLKSDPPLKIWIEHVNHAPYVVNSKMLILHFSEDQSNQELDLLSFISDVDLEDQEQSSGVDSLTFYVQSQSPWMVQALVHGNMLRLMFQENQNGIVLLNVTAVDIEGASASTLIQVNVASIADDPFPQYILSQQAWQSETAQYCDDGQVPVGTLVEGPIDRYSVTLQQCQNSCVDDIECVGITYMTAGDRCRKAIRKCNLRQSGNHSMVYMRPTGLILHEDEISSIDVSALFGDVDNCGSLRTARPCSNENDAISIFARSNDESRVTVKMNGTMLIVGGKKDMHTCTVVDFWQCHHRFANIPVVVNISAVDLSNRTSWVTLNVSILAVNDIPVAFLSEIHLTEGSPEQNITSINVTHSAEALDVASGWAIVDPDMSKNPGGDSLFFQVHSSDLGLYKAKALTLTSGGSAPEGSRCSFPFTVNSVQYSNCTTASVDNSSWCKTADGNWGYCQHVIQISLETGQFGRAFMNFTIRDSFGESLVTSTNVLVHMVNDAPLFNLPPAFTIYKRFHFASELDLYPRFVSIVPEDECRRPPVRVIGDCWGLGGTGQNTTFSVQVIDGDPSIFLILPQVNRNGDLSFRLRQASPGELNLTITLTDDGGTGYGGVNHSTRVLAMKVLPLPENLIIPENVDGHAISLYYPFLDANWAPARGMWSQHLGVNFAAKEHEHSNQSLTLTVSKEAGDDLFFEPPSLKYQGLEGILNFTQIPDRHGFATFRVKLEDGLVPVEQGGVVGFDYADTIFTITVEQISNAPSFCTSHPLLFLEDWEYENVSFLEVSTGGSKCLLNKAECGGVYSRTSFSTHSER